MLHRPLGKWVDQLVSPFSDLLEEVMDQAKIDRALVLDTESPELASQEVVRQTPLPQVFRIGLLVRKRKILMWFFILHFWKLLSQFR